MNTTPRPTLESLLGRGRINAAIAALERTAASSPDLRAEASDSLARVKESYALLTRYALGGADDPTRADLYNDICADLRDIAARLRRRRMLRDNPSLYFSTLRAAAARRDSGHTIPAVIDRWQKLIGAAGLALLSGTPATDPSTGRPLRPAIDTVERDIFHLLWTTHPLSADDAAAIDRFVAGRAIPSESRQLVVAALMMGELEWHDDRRIASLVKAYLDDDTAVSVKALCALFAALWIHRRRPMRRRALNAIATAADSPRWASDMQMTFLEMIRARDTERVNRKIHDEILPDLMKMKPDLEKRLRDSGGAIDPESFEENPEWEEMLDKSGLKDKLKELSEMQEEGTDVMMGTFLSLKSFPFFNDIHHWFIPFMADHPSIATEGSAEWRNFVDVVSSAAFLCDNDKYSLACAFSMMPTDRRDLLLTQFKMQNVNLAEIKASTLTTASTDRRAAAARWIQSLYRFFKLFRRKGEFDDLFGEPFNPLEIPGLTPVFNNADILGLAAEFYFKRGYRAEASSLFDHLLTIVPATPQLLQKSGYCLQRAGDLDGAIERYRHAELLDSANLWTLRRLGACLRLAGKPAEALPYLKQVADARPDDPAAALALGHCLTELERYADAAAQYFKVDFLDPGSGRALRPLAWALMLGDNPGKSRPYHRRILDLPDVTATDRLNAGHLELITGHYARAAELYAASLASTDGGAEAFSAAFEADLPLLEKHGADPLMARIVADSVLAVNPEQSTTI